MEDEAFNFDLTKEQTEIVNYEMEEGEVLKINAFAGTGKTFTCRAYCKKRPNSSFLLLTFNKEAARDNRIKFEALKNVECTTVDSKVYKHLCEKFKIGNGMFSTADIYPYLANQPFEKNCMTQFVFDMCVTTLKTFCNSADVDIGDEHLPVCLRSTFQRADAGLSYQVYKCSRLLWEILLTKSKVQKDDVVISQEKSLVFSLPCSSTEKDGENDTPKENAAAAPVAVPLSITYEMARKLFQSNAIKLEGVDYIIVDEAQDMNPVMLEILKEQSHCKRIVVGDRHQSIYSFMQSVNAMEAFPHAKQFSLSQSFRYGCNIARILNKMLHLLKSETKIIQGVSEDKGKVLHFNQEISCTPRHLFVNQESAFAPPPCYLFRHNISVFSKTLQLSKQHSDMCIYVLGGKEKWVSLANQVEDTYNLLKLNSRKFWKRYHDLERNAEGGRQPSKEEIAFSTFAIMKYVEKHIKTLGASLQYLKQFGKDNILENPSGAHFFVGTVHQSKGKEYDFVVLGEDFSLKTPKSLKNNKERVKQLEEYNIMYVALSRAKSVVCLPINMGAFLSEVQEDKDNSSKEKGKLQCSIINFIKRKRNDDEELLEENDVKETVTVQS